MSEGAKMGRTGHRITGNVRVEDRVKGRVWVAAYVQADGAKTRKTLGRAWVRDSGRKTARGAAIWRAGDGPKPDDTYLTPTDAQDALDALLVAERAKPTVPRRTRAKTLADAGAAWLTHVENFHGVEPTTLRNYRVIVGKLEDEFSAQLPLRKLTIERLRGYQDRLLADRAEPLARKTIRNRMLVLRGILDHARELGWISANPMNDVPIVAQPLPNPDFNVLEPSQVEAVANSVTELDDGDLPLMRNGEVDDHSLAAMRERRLLYAEVVRFAAYTGLRFGELRALRWRDVDRRGAGLRVPRNAPSSAPAGSKVKAPKSRRGRSVPLIDDAIAVLDRVARAGYPTGRDDLVFPTRRAGHIDSGAVREAFYRGLVAAGLGYMREKDNPITFHDLRHTFGTIAVRRLPLSDVQAYMGHADIQTTMRYVHHRPRNDAARELSLAFAADLAGPEDPATELAA
ncbi:MAG TPA: tyrosine-type recombinase/integrase [Thermoleophilaceae bacterium]|nr:tyrosine-type recombinase/integrase [Thermoleophilaceae bacterium]